MKLRVRLFQPGIQVLEDRTALSFSFSNLIHSVFPFVSDKTSKPKHRPAILGTQSAATITPAVVTPHVRAVHAGRIHAMVQPINVGQVVTPTAAHPRGAFNVYGVLPAKLNARLR